MSAKANTVFNIMPMTFILPKEYVGFLENFSEFEELEGKFNYWIMKPAAKSCSKCRLIFRLNPSLQLDN